MKVFVIVEPKDVGSRDRIMRDLLASSSVYGGPPLPCFGSREIAEAYISEHEEGWRDFEVRELTLANHVEITVVRAMKQREMCDGCPDMGNQIECADCDPADRYNERKGLDE